MGGCGRQDLDVSEESAKCARGQLTLNAKILTCPEDSVKVHDISELSSRVENVLLIFQPGSDSRFAFQTL